MSSKSPLYASCVCLLCVLACAACSKRKAVANYEGVDPRGQRVEVALYVPPFVAATPVCLRAAKPDVAEMKIVALPPSESRPVTLHVSRKHYSECGVEVFTSVVYWETTLKGPEICFYQPASRAAAHGDRDVTGAWTYCALLHPSFD